MKSDTKPGFSVERTFRHGFHVTFANGWTVSTQFANGNYVNNRNRLDESESDTAEIAVWNSKGDFCRHVILNNSDDVIGWQTPADWLAVLNRVASMPENCPFC